MAAKLIYLTDKEFDRLSVKLNMGGPEFDIINLEHTLIFMRDKCNKENKMQPKITKTEAINLFKKHIPYMSSADTEKFISFFIAAEMLEVNEEEETSFAIAIQQHKLVPRNITLSCISDILAAISAMGYKITVNNN